MRRPLLVSALLCALLLLPVTAASAAPARPATTPRAVVGAGLPIFPATSATVPPPGFHSTALQAITAAKHDPRMQALHRRLHPLYVQAYIWGTTDGHWYINFAKGRQNVAEVDVSRDGRVTGVWTGPLAVALYARGGYSPLFDSWYVVLPFSLAFLLPFLDIRRLRRLLHLDALVLLSFLVSYWLFDHTHLEAAVWLMYPPLLYLLARMVAIGTGRSRTTGWIPPLSTRVLFIGLLALVAARIALNFIYGPVSDVGYASVLGAHRVTQGLPLYYADPSHGDTYGPFAYLAYVPFERLFPWAHVWGYVPAAHVAALVFDLVTIGGLVLLGRRLRSGRDGLRLGLMLGWAYAACPFTLLGVISHTNDGLVAALSVLALLAFASPAARGAILGLAAAAKFSPAGLLPLFAAPRERGIKDMLKCVAAFAAVLVTTVVAYLPPGGLKEFYDHTLGFQLTRPDIFSLWGLHPSLDPLKIAVAALAAVFALSLALTRRRRSLVQVCALSAAVTIALQLSAVHWFYYYIIWFVPFVAVALLAAPSPAPAQPAEATDEQQLWPAEAEPELVGA